MHNKAVILDILDILVHLNELLWVANLLTEQHESSQLAYHVCAN